MSLSSITPAAGRIAEIRATLGRRNQSATGFSQRLSAAQNGDSLNRSTPAISVEEAAKGVPISAATITSLTSGATNGAPGIVKSPAPVAAADDDSAAPISTAGADATTNGPPVPDADVLAAQVSSDTPYADLFNTAGARHGVSPALLASVAQVESAFDPTAISSAGAGGLMQFMPATAAEMGVDRFEPASAIDGAARYLARDLERFGRLDHAIAAYNAGPGAVAEHGGIPPFAETREYVRRVLTALEARR